MAEISLIFRISVVRGNLEIGFLCLIIKEKCIFYIIESFLTNIQFPYRWTNINESSRSGMAVLDVAIPTGYIIQQQNLDKYVLSRQVRNLQRARFQGRKVLFYFDYLDQEETCVNFTIERWYPVANMSRYLPIRVYDYYAPERFNESIFDALPTYTLNICEVCGSSQCPYCPIYNTATIFMSSTNLICITTILITIMRYYQTQEFNVG